MQNKKTLLYILLTFIIVSCTGTVTNKQIVEDKQPLNIVDTVDSFGRRFRIFDNDSIHFLGVDLDEENPRVERVEYIGNTTVGELRAKHFDYGKLIYTTYVVDSTQGTVHTKTFYSTGELRQIAYVKDTLLCDTTELKKEKGSSFLRSDLVEEYSKEGTLLKSGYVGYYTEENHRLGSYEFKGVWKTYDPQGRIRQIEMPIDPLEGTPIRYEDFYENGQLRSSSIQGGMYNQYYNSEFHEYDSLGHKQYEVYEENLEPKWGGSYNDRFTVATIKEYYTNGKLKKMSKEKSFVETDQYPCGKWIYYNEKGRVTKTETYGDCYNFELEDDVDE